MRPLRVSDVVCEDKGFMIYIGTDEGIYRWIDKSFWPAFHSLQGRGVVSLACPAPGLMSVVDSGGRIWESENNGIDWREVPAPAASVCRPLGVASGAGVDSVVLTTRPMGLYERIIGSPIAELGAADSPRTTSNSRRWALIEYATAGGAGQLALALRRRRRKHTTGRGASEPGDDSQTKIWTSLQVPSVAGQAVPPVIRALAVGDGEAAAWYAAVTGAGLWRSDDGGDSWEQCPGLPAEVYAIRTAPGAKGTVVVATSDGCWASADCGQTWEDRSGGLEQARQLRAIELHPEDPNSMLAGAAAAARPADGQAKARRGTRFSLYETADGGKKWTHVRRGFPEVLEYDTITDIRYDPAATENAIVALDSGELWRTRNGGDWWEPIARQIHAARVLCAVK
jgi:hypothetical protein